MMTTVSPKSDVVIEVQNIVKYFPVREGIIFQREVANVHAVDDISFQVRRGETLGLVGESGCGKTTTARIILKLLPKTSGRVWVEGKEITTIDEIRDDVRFKFLHRWFNRIDKIIYFCTFGRVSYKYGDLRADLQAFRRKIQIIFQDPYSSLNPRLTVYDIISEGLSIHNLVQPEPRGPFKGVKQLIGSRIWNGITRVIPWLNSTESKERRVLELMETVGLAPFHIYRYPHEFSGGQRQRVGIARALAVNPEIVVCDEPVSALDVSVRAQVLNLLEDLQNAYDLTYVFIAHDLSVVRHFCDRVLVMYVGKAMEVAETDELYNTPFHPYTEALMSAVPIPDPTAALQRIILKGDVPTPTSPPSGCRFHPRCGYNDGNRCVNEEPPLTEYAPGHWAACHYPLTQSK